MRKPETFGKPKSQAFRSNFRLQVSCYACTEVLGSAEKKKSRNRLRYACPHPDAAAGSYAAASAACTLIGSGADALLRYCITTVFASLSSTFVCKRAAFRKTPIATASWQTAANGSCPVSLRAHAGAPFRGVCSSSPNRSSTKPCPILASQARNSPRGNRKISLNKKINSCGNTGRTYASAVSQSFRIP